MTTKKPVYILGISCFYHDASAALLKDGIIVAAAEEERFTRKKHDHSFPSNAIVFCMEKEKITIKEIAYVGFYEKPFLKFERLLSQHIEMFPLSFKTFLSSIPSWINEKLRIPSIIKRKLGYDGDVLFVEHHLAHAASSFLVSPFRKAAVLTVDGVGEWTTTSYGYAEENEIHLMKQISFPHSLGLLYSTITAYLGFSVNNSEYKVMGLAPYGDMDRTTNEHYKKLKQVIDVKDDGSYRLDMQYFVFHYKDRMPSKKLCQLLDGEIRKPESEVTQRHKDIAAAVQLVLEDVMTTILCHVHKETKCDNIILGGGVALNSVYNGKILKKTPFKHLWIHPNASDGGTSIGVASYVYHTLLGNKREYILEQAYLGPAFSNDEIKHFLDEKNVIHTSFPTEKTLIETTAKLLVENNVVGWFQLGMEWGPRALGARSILSNPCNNQMKEILNQKVKHRELFRPFAPVICADDTYKYFNADQPLPNAADYMLLVYPIKKEYHTVLPAITHVDGSGRLQTVHRGQNPLYYDVIKAFGKLSKTPVLINTSFNIRGEPIVCTPYDAYKCMMGTGIDYLVIGNFLIKRADNLRDAWDSEKYAVD